MGHFLTDDFEVFFLVMRNEGRMVLLSFAAMMLGSVFWVLTLSVIE